MNKPKFDRVKHGRNAYKRSTRRERETVNKARALGLVAGRTAGSHSPFDVYVWNRRERLLKLIQVKTHKGAQNCMEIDRKVFDNCTVIEATWEWK